MMILCWHCHAELNQDYSYREQHIVVTMASGYLTRQENRDVLA